MKLDIDFHKIDLPVELMQICDTSVACVYAVIRSEAENGVCELSKNELCRITGIGTKSLQRIIVRLELLGIVERHYNPGYATSYYVKDILPTERPEPAKVPAEPVEPARQSEQSSDLKPGYKFYGEYCWIALTENEYAELVSEYGKRTIDNTISEIDNNREANKQYLPSTVHHGAYGKAYIKDWIRKDDKRKNKGKKDIIREQEMRELDKYLDLVNEEWSEN